VRSFEQALENLGKDYEIEIYPNVGHAFANPSGANYDAEAASRAWKRTVEFLRRKLAAADD
jgi:carboxymethylenebutenolidase